MLGDDYPLIDTRVALRKFAAETYQEPVPVPFREYVNYFHNRLDVMRTPISVEEQVDIMAEYNVKGVIAAGDAETTYDLHTPVEDIAEVVEEYPERFAGLVGVDPHKGMDAVEKLEYSIRELGLSGVDLAPFLHKLDTNAKEYYPIYAKAAELGVPIHIHTSNHFNRDQGIAGEHPEYLDEVATHFPDLELVARHGGWPWIDEMIAVAFRHDNVYIELSGIHPSYWDDRIVERMDGMLQEKVLWGTSYPVVGWDSLSVVDDLDISAETKRKLCHDNAAELFDL